MTNLAFFCYVGEVTRTCRYRLNPSRVQAATLFSWLHLTREFYNAALEEREQAWERQHHSVSLFDQQAQVSVVRAERGDLAKIPVVVLRGALRRADLAYQAFYRRCKSGQKPGHPRYKSTKRWRTLEFYETLAKSPIVAGRKRLVVRLLGKVKLNYHRLLEGRPRSMKFTLSSDGHWYVTITCDSVESRLLPKTKRTVGIDLGLTHFAATSDGELFENPRPLRQARLGLERAQRRVSRRRRGSRRKCRAVQLLGKRHVHVVNVRREHHITVVKKLVTNYDVIFKENLNVHGLAKSNLAKSVHDVAWSNFNHWLTCKAEEAGREIVEVDPRGTSITCSHCGTVDVTSRDGKVFCCAHCIFVGDADVNAAINIKRLGTSLRGAATPVRVRQRSAKSASTCGPGHARLARGQTPTRGLSSG